MGERMHIIGPGDNPILICKKKEVKGLFTNEFYFLFEVWQYHYYKMGLPDKKHWTEQDPDLMKIIIMMDAHFNINFSANTVIIKYMEAIIKRLDNLGRRR